MQDELDGASVPISADSDSDLDSLESDSDSESQSDCEMAAEPAFGPRRPNRLTTDTRELNGVDPRKAPSFGNPSGNFPTSSSAQDLDAVMALELQRRLQQSNKPDLSIDKTQTGPATTALLKQARGTAASTCIRVADMIDSLRSNLVVLKPQKNLKCN